MPDLIVPKPAREDEDPGRQEVQYGFRVERHPEKTRAIDCHGSSEITT